MCTEIVAGGTLTLPQALGVVGIVPGLLVLIFCGVFALYTALLLVDFKLNHPQVYSMVSRVMARHLLYIFRMRSVDLRPQADSYFARAG